MRLAQDTRRRGTAAIAQGGATQAASAAPAIDQAIATSRLAAASDAKASSTAAADIIDRSPALAAKLDAIEARLDSIDPPPS